MTNTGALEKRIKRNVTAREHRFFVVVSPGLESVCQKELENLLGPDRPVSLIDGGLEFTGPVTDLYRANLHLRTASRVLMRFAGFSATDFRTLEKKLRDIPWELYLSRSHIPGVHVTTQKSRLHHTGAIDQRFRESIAWRLETAGIPVPDENGTFAEQQIFVRVVHDRFELSLDSSGDLLYMRGLKTQGGKAPMRETLAAGLLILAGYHSRMPLVDPMCGAGSFSLEAALMAKGIPPGWFRTFAFENWPCFRQGAFRHIRSIAEEAIIREPLSLIFASDTDGKTCTGLTDTVKRFGLADLVQVRQADVFDLDPPCPAKGLVMVNPPYGLRLGTEKASRTLIENLVKTLKKQFRGWSAGVVSPFDRPSVRIPGTMARHTFYHGGLRVFLFSGKI